MVLREMPSERGKAWLHFGQPTSSSAATMIVLVMGTPRAKLALFAGLGGVRAKGELRENVNRRQCVRLRPRRAAARAPRMQQFSAALNPNEVCPSHFRGIRR